MKIKELFRKGASSPSPSDKGAGSDTGAGSLRSHSDLKKTLFHSDDTYGLRILHEPAKPTIDIIFVHGLTGKSFDTWLAKSGTYWPTQLLPDDIPDARIMTFGYDADVTKLVGPVGQSNIREHASTFFRELNMVRAKDQSTDRNIIIIAHSLGGLVTKKALYLSEQASKSYEQQLSHYTIAVAFLGTPHRGADLASFATGIANILKTAGKRVNRDILTLLKRNSESLAEVDESFDIWLQKKSNRFDLSCFYEELQLPGVGMVVTKDSAKKYPYPSYPIPANHMDMTKFSDREETGYRRILGELSRWISEMVPPEKANTTLIPESLEADEQSRKCLKNLCVTDPEQDKKRIENEKDPLRRDCYTWILEDKDLRDWQDGRDSQLLWIKGDPGKGKTMLMIALANELSKSLGQRHESGALAYFFCQSTDSRLNSAVSVLRGLIFLLVGQNQMLIRYVRDEYDKIGGKLFNGPNALYSLWSILSNILKDSSLPTVYLLVDALDECNNGLSQFLKLISEYSSESPSKVKWLLSSRHRSDIEAFLRPEGSRKKINLELNSQHISRAVDLFIGYKIEELGKQKEYDEHLREKLTNQLKEKAESTFLWVALACKMLGDVPRWKTLSVLQELPSGLEPLYDRMMKQVLRLKDGRSKEYCLQILRSVTIAYRPLIIEELVPIAGLPGNLLQDIKSLQELVEMCGSFLTVRRRTAHFVHLSAKDYFVNGGGQSIFSTGPVAEHSMIFDRCFESMSLILNKRDLCSLGWPGTRATEAKINRSVQSIEYACCFWVDHLDRIREFAPIEQSQDLLTDSGRVHKFLQSHLLYWLEAMSLLGKISEGILIFMHLKEMIQSRNDTLLYKLVYDANRFIRQNKSIFEEAPLQVYCSLVFLPEMSIIRRIFVDQIPNWIYRLPTVPKYWNSVLQTLEGHTEWVSAVVFSPDGTLVASGSSDCTVRLWDAATGSLRRTLEGHMGWVSAVAFSPHGTLVVSGSRDRTVRLWDATTRSLRRTLEGHTEWVCAVAFSPDGTLVASGSHDRTVRLWDVATGSLRRTLEGHTDWVRAVAFSPDGTLVASGSHDRTVRLWDTATGLAREELHLNSIIWKLSFSSDGSCLETNRGQLDIKSRATLSSTSKLSGHIFLEEQWVACGKGNILRFSPEYRAVCAASSNETFVVGHGSGLVAFWGFDISRILISEMLF